MPTEMILQKYDECFCYSQRCPKRKSFYKTPGILCMCQEEQIMIINLCYLASFKYFHAIFAKFTPHVQQKKISALLVNTKKARSTARRTGVDILAKIPIVGLASQLLFVGVVMPTDQWAARDMSQFIDYLRQFRIPTEPITSLREGKLWIKRHVHQQKS